MFSPHDLAARMEALRQMRLRFPDAQWEPQGVPDSAPIIRCTINQELRWIPMLPGEPKVCASLQEARRLVNTYDLTHLPTLQRGFGLHPLEQDLPARNAAPARALFEAHQVLRIPVEVDERAKDFLDTGNQQTRIFGQALAEAFGQMAGVERITIAWQELATFQVPTLLVTAQAEDPAQSHSWHLRTDELLLILPTKEIAFQARYAAAELVRLYIEHQNR